jgi:hypothetical protein
VRAGAPTAELHIRRHLVERYDTERDPVYEELLGELVDEAVVLS